MTTASTVDEEYRRLNYRLRRLYETGILDLSDYGHGMTTMTQSKVTDFPEDVITQRLLDEKTPPETAQLCLWHILWEICHYMSNGNMVANGVRTAFPTPTPENPEHPTIYGVGEIKENGNIVFDIAKSPSSFVAQEARKRFDEQSSQWDLKFRRILIWRVRTGRHSTTLHFTPLPEVV